MEGEKTSMRYPHLWKHGWLVTSRKHVDSYETCIGGSVQKKKTYYERGRRCENGGDIAEGGHGGGKNGKIKLYHKWRRRCESGGDVAKGGHGGGN
jgi:hypothetical protein